MKIFSLKNNILAYLVSMRWYGSFISAMAGLVGITFSNANPEISKQIIVWGVLFIGWGINQVINDYLGLAEDRFNAPNRPMVTGRLNSRFALILSIIMFLTGLIITYWLKKQAIIFYLAIFALNTVYERTKRMTLLGNIFFGLLITLCIYYAAVCVTEKILLDVLLDGRLATLAILVWLINFTLCFFSDFKDFEGDKKANVRTLVVVLGLNRARYLGFILITMPFVCLYSFFKLSLLFPYIANKYFLVMLLLSFLSFLYPALLVFKSPQGENAYYSLKWVTVAVVLFETALIGLVNPCASIILFIFNFICVRLLSALYKDHLA